MDGNSRDKTVEVAISLGAEVIEQNGRGKGDAVYCALNHLKDKKIDYLILIDADHTYPPQYIPEMIKTLELNASVGMVCGNRYNPKLPRKTGGYAFSLGNRLLASLHKLINGVNLNDPLTGLRVIRWSAIKDWKPHSKGFDIEVELNSYIQKQYGIKEMDIAYRQRLGTKKLKVRHGLSIFGRMLKEALTVSKGKLGGSI